MFVNQGLELDVRGVVLVGGSLVGGKAQLRHAVVTAQREAVALDIHPLAQFVLVVQGGTAQLKVDGTGFVLQVNLVVDVPALVAGGYLAFDPDVSVHQGGLALVQGFECCDGDPAHALVGHIGIRVERLLGRFVLSVVKYRIPLVFQTLAGNDGREGGKGK